MYFFCVIFFCFITGTKLLYFYKMYNRYEEKFLLFFKVIFNQNVNPIVAFVKVA